MLTSNSISKNSMSEEKNLATGPVGHKGLTIEEYMSKGLTIEDDTQQQVGPTGSKGIELTEDDFIRALPRTMHWPFAVKGKDFPAAVERLTRVLLGSDDQDSVIQDLKAKVNAMESILKEQADIIRQHSSGISVLQVELSAIKSGSV